MRGAPAWRPLRWDRSGSWSRPTRRSLPNGFWSGRCSRVATSSGPSIANCGPNVSDGATKPLRSRSRERSGASAPRRERSRCGTNKRSEPPSKFNCKNSASNRQREKPSARPRVPNKPSRRGPKKGGAEPTGHPQRRVGSGDVGERGDRAAGTFIGRPPHVCSPRRAHDRTAVAGSGPIRHGCDERADRPASRGPTDPRDVAVPRGRTLAGLVHRPGGPAGQRRSSCRSGRSHGSSPPCSVA